MNIRFIRNPILLGASYSVVYSLFFRYFWDHLKIEQGPREILGHWVFFGTIATFVNFRYIFPALIFGTAIGLKSLYQISSVDKNLIGEYVQYQEIDKDFKNEIEEKEFIQRLSITSYFQEKSDQINNSKVYL